MRINKLLIIKSLIYGCIVIFLMVLQTNVLNHIKIFGVKPNLFVSLMAVVAIYENERYSAVLGIVVGFILDVAFSSPFFFSGILFFLCGFAGGIVSRLYFRQTVITMIIITSAVAFIRMIANFVYLLGIWSEFEASAAFSNYLLPEFIFTVAVCPIVYFLVKFTAAKIDYNQYLL